MAVAARSHARFAAGMAVAGLVLLLDQWSKAAALAALFAPSRAVAITPFFNLTPVWNRGVSFGLLAGDSPWLPLLLSGFAGLVVLGLCVWLWRARSAVLTVALGLIVGGAIGNIIDRMRFGAVVDFIDLHAGNLHWPAFNIADAAITLGVMLVLLDGFLPRAGRRRADRRGG